MEDLKSTRKNAMLAQCHQCCGYYMDGKIDCENVKCSIYQWMPYRKLEPDYSWLEYNPTRRGRQKLSEIDTSNRNTEHLAQYRFKKEEQE